MGQLEAEWFVGQLEAEWFVGQLEAEWFVGQLEAEWFVGSLRLSDLSGSLKRSGRDVCTFTSVTFCHGTNPWYSRFLRRTYFLHDGQEDAVVELHRLQNL